MFRILFSILLCVSTFSMLNAGEPVWGVEIILESLTKDMTPLRVVSNQNGHFSFKKLPKDTYLLKVLMEEDREFAIELKSSKKLYKKYSKSLKAAYDEDNKQVMFTSVAGCHLLKLSKIKNGEEKDILADFNSEFLGSKELLTVSEITFSEKKGKLEGKIQTYNVKKYFKKAGQKKFPNPVKRVSTDG